VQCGGQAGIAAADDDDVGGVVATQRRERRGVLDAGRLNPRTVRSRAEERASRGAVPFPPAVAAAAAVRNPRRDTRWTWGGFCVSGEGPFLPFALGVLTLAPF
jgi:hypothetical protein